MNVRPVVLVVIIVGCSVLGWMIGRQTLIKIDSEQLEKLSQNTLVPKEDVSLKVSHIKKGDSQNIPTSNQSHNLSSKSLTLTHQNAVLSSSNVQQEVRKVVPSGEKAHATVYTHDMNSWKLDTSVCSTEKDFLKVFLKTTVGQTPIYIHNPNDDIWISKNLLNSGHWEGAFVNLVFKLLKEDQDLQFVDLGANIGVFALSVAKLGRKVIAVEPLSINLQRLCKSVEAGIASDGEPFVNKITIIHNALSDQRESVQLGKDRQNVGGTYVLKDSNEKKVQGSAVNGKYSDVVMTAKLDDLLNLPHFDFKKVILKIDVEGYESKVFNGGKSFFNTVDVKAVLMEWRWHEGAKDIQSLLDFFTNRNYKPYNPVFQPPSPLQISDSQRWPGDVLWQK